MAKIYSLDLNLSTNCVICFWIIVSAYAAAPAGGGFLGGAEKRKQDRGGGGGREQGAVADLVITEDRLHKPLFLKLEPASGRKNRKRLLGPTPAT